MSNISILAVKPKTLTKKQKEDLRECGVIAIESDEPSSVRFIRPDVDVPYSGMFTAALKIIAEDKAGHQSQKTAQNRFCDAIAALAASDTFNAQSGEGNGASD